MVTGVTGTSYQVLNAQNALQVKNDCSIFQYYGCSIFQYSVWFIFCKLYFTKEKTSPCNNLLLKYSLVEGVITMFLYHFFTKIIFHNTVILTNITFLTHNSFGPIKLLEPKDLLEKKRCLDFKLLEFFWAIFFNPNFNNFSEQFFLIQTL